MRSVLDKLAQEHAGRWAVMLGMPVNEHKDEAYRELLTELWQGQRETGYGPLRIHRVATTPEPLGSFWNYVMEHPVREADLLNQRVVIVDFGYFTTDINAVNRMRLNSAVANTVTLGMRDVYRLMADLIHRKHRKACENQPPRSWADQRPFAVLPHRAQDGAESQPPSPTTSICTWRTRSRTAEPLGDRGRR